MIIIWKHPSQRGRVGWWSHGANQFARGEAFADGNAETWRWLDPNTARISSLNSWLVLQPGAQRNVDRDLSRMFQVVPLKVSFQ